MKSCFHEPDSIINITIHFRTKRQLRNIHKFEMVVIINFDGEKKIETRIDDKLYTPLT